MTTQAPALLFTAARRLNALYGTPHGPSSSTLYCDAVSVASSVPVQSVPGSSDPCHYPPGHEAWVSVSLGAARQLQCSHGGWVLTRWSEASERAVVAQLLIAIGEGLAAPSPTVQQRITLGVGPPPLPVVSAILAFNLGLPYTVQPFLETASAAAATSAPGASTANDAGSAAMAAAAPLLTLPLTTPLQVLGLAAALADAALHSPGPLAADAVSRHGTSSSAGIAAVPGALSPANYPLAESVQLCKVGVPRTTPLARVAGGGASTAAAASGGSKGPLQGGPDAAIAAADGGSTGGDAVAAAAGPAAPLAFASDELSAGDSVRNGGGGGGGGGSTAVVRDAVARALQRYFRERGRHVMF
ncbi:hypothetical protein VOLCADRAFT_89452 [Volvox carteri f. nagariensis]|uniref:Uncharacterized protein n=1 Tax=Volvox carteri f. nagariensis TaxID=3068 RepID=D8TRQ7_VOLCA|nr:uncharacterized protein VOLCADRAFT_89452 [Volvox carteri f. nagariensis]EFJ50031.1 hypothetical protein VOLCADRAFT_89452 [Volvox carteri f. nagariensis]|eukprot:XP_002949096.1 hypothetical protein VOLCADRAFT_89452 [Volvox carteri f. nagariensis]